MTSYLTQAITNSENVVKARLEDLRGDMRLLLALVADARNLGKFPQPNVPAEIMEWFYADQKGDCAEHLAPFASQAVH